MTWNPELEELARREALAAQMGGDDKVSRQHDAGRLTVRERIHRLVDAGSFHEVGALSGVGEYDAQGALKQVTPANCVFGRAALDGRPVVVVGDDFTVRGGSADASIGNKPLMAEDMAAELRLPIVRIIEGSGGGGSVKTIETKGASNLPGGVGGTRLFWRTTANLAEVPVVGLGLGSVAGLGAARLASTHFSVMTKASAMFVAGPPVVARLGQALDKQELGGADIQTRSGAVDLAVDTEDEAFAAARRFLSYLPPSVHGLPPVQPNDDDPQRADEMLMSAVPRDRRKVYKMRPIIEAVVDRGSFFEMGRNFGRSIIAGLARLQGHPVLLLASDPFHYGGAWGAETCQKVVRYRRPGRDLPPAGGLPDGLPGLHDRAGGRAQRHHPPRRARDGRAEPEHGAVVHGDRAQCLRRGRRGAPAGRALLAALRVAVGQLGQPAAGRRHRGRLPRRDRGRARPEGQAGRDRGAAERAALAVPQRRALLGRGDHRPAAHARAVVRLRPPGRTAAHAGPRPLCHAALNPPGPQPMKQITVNADVAGTVWKIVVAVGDRVGADQELLILESMKMEIPASAPQGGVVRKILVAQGEAIAEGQGLLIIECP